MTALSPCRKLLPVFLTTSDIEINPKCEGTLCDPYSEQHSSYCLQPWTYLYLGEVGDSSSGPNFQNQYNMGIQGPVVLSLIKLILG